MMLAAHSVYDQYGKLIAVCPDSKTADSLAWTLTMVLDTLHHAKETIPDELLGMLAETPSPRDQRYQSVAGVGQAVVVIPNFRDEPVEPVDN